MNQTELDLEGVKAKVRAVRAALDKAANQGDTENVDLTAAQKSVDDFEGKVDGSGGDLKADSVRKAIDKAFSVKDSAVNGAVVDAVYNAVKDLENQLEDLTVQYLDNSKPADPAAGQGENTAPGKVPETPAETAKAHGSDPTP